MALDTGIHAGMTALRFYKLFASSQAPAWEFSFGSSCFQSHEAGASPFELPSKELGSQRKKCKGYLTTAKKLSGIKKRQKIHVVHVITDCSKPKKRLDGGLFCTFMPTVTQSIYFSYD
jgi:hypothetical protein